MPGWIFSGYSASRTRPATPTAEAPATTAASAPAEEQLPMLTWNGAAHMSAGCPCVAVYSECRCAATNISARTNAADFHADQQ